MTLNTLSCETKYDVVISGCGPAALAFAWEAAKRNKSVLLVSKRNSDFIRTQTLYLTMLSRRFLLDMLEFERNDYHTLTRYEAEIRQLLGVQLKDMERFIWDRIDHLSFCVDVQHRMEISDVDLEEGAVTIRSVDAMDNSEKKINCRFLVGADGIQHNATDKVNAKLSPEDRIYFVSTSCPLVENHFSIYLLVSRIDEGVLFPEGNFLHSKITRVDNDCVFNIFPNLISLEKHAGTRIKLGISGEITDDIANIENTADRNNALLSYLSGYIKKEFFDHMDPDELVVDTPKSRKHGIKKDHLALCFFKVSGGKADRSVVVGEGLTAVFAGDAAVESNYQTAMGINGIFESDAPAFGLILDAKNENEMKMALSSYDAKINERAQNMSETTDMVNEYLVMPVAGRRAFAQKIQKLDFEGEEKLEALQADSVSVVPKFM